MRILVTGASGFSGSYIASALALRGHEVVGLYRSETLFLGRVSAAPRARSSAARWPSSANIAGPFDAVVHTGRSSGLAGLHRHADHPRQPRRHRALLAPRSNGAASGSSISPLSRSTARSPCPSVDEHTPIVAPDTYGTQNATANGPCRLRRVAARPGSTAARDHRSWRAAQLALYGWCQLFGRASRPRLPFGRALQQRGAYRRYRGLTARSCEQGWQGFDAVVLGAGGSITVRGAIERLAAGLGISADIGENPAPKPGFTLSSRHAIERWGYAPMEIGAMIDRYAQEIRAEPHLPSRSGGAG